MYVRPSRDISPLLCENFLTHQRIKMGDQNFQSSIDACCACAIECSYCISECLLEQEIKMLARCIRLNHDCTAICFIAMGSIAGGSEFAKKICQLCAEICTACAIECEKHAHMEHCAKCAEACRKCAAECESLVKM